MFRLLADVEMNKAQLHPGWGLCLELVDSGQASPSEDSKPNSSLGYFYNHGGEGTFESDIAQT